MTTRDPDSSSSSETFNLPPAAAPDAGAPQESAETCLHETGRYWRATLICDRCGERVGDHYVHGLDGLRWNLRWIAIGHPDWKDNTEAPAPAAHQERTDPTEGNDDRDFIERRWREGVREAEYCARCCSLDPTPIANPYDPTSLAGTWWLRGYESMRAILRQSEPGAPARAAEWQPLLEENEDLSRIVNREIRDHLQSSAATDAGSQKDSAGTK